ncbi:MAG: ATP-binding protein [Clostridia bacterium]|nr:ATP-binding protein [Clostridia bacterium]
MKQYRKRIVDEILSEKLEGKGAVLIEGPKWCGKTTTAEQMAASVLYMDDPEAMEQNINMASVNPKMLLRGETPRLIDEWQLAPKLWDAIRFEVDHRDDLGQFILTGSSVPADTTKITHSGTGRFSWLSMRPMSLYESWDSNGQVSLGELFRTPDQIEGMASLDLERLAFLICRGGWPRAIDMRDKIALNQAFDYYDAVVHSDINRADGVTKDPQRVHRLMRSLARNQGQQVANSAIAADIGANDDASINQETVASYIAALKKIFVVEDMPAWNPNLRSQTAIRTSDTRYFVDQSIATAALGIGPNDLIADLKTMGFLFETMCVRDLRVYAEALDGTVAHFRNKAGLECDAVVHLRNGSYGLVEIKLGGDKLIEEGVATLKKLSGLIDTTQMKEPSFLMVLTGVGTYAYRREDGVYIVPIGCLKN